MIKLIIILVVYAFIVYKLTNVAMDIAEGDRFDWHD